VAGRWREILNSVAKDYGGSGVGNAGMVDANANEKGQISAEMVLPPLSTIMLELVEEFAAQAVAEETAAKPVAKKKVSSRKKKVVEEAA
ncbi:MAG: alpha amylase C-terminal domain-containing protein, partial [Rhizobiaceae bacterium]